eukprot:TRINITY_DN19073_c0_g1_i3.p1 TRINITY_DN19073_c0_g1~~TRINITY_DN19073_c0_g1_i3.p1  ORF type:complete len:491 (-),score=97.07 TRINITY_DN19073_c0_g1_i3:10-1482(-)
MIPISTKFIRTFKRNFTSLVNGKQKLVILGTGWGSFKTLSKIDTSKYDVTVVSPRNHFLFTPLLASTTVGTLDFRSIIDPVRRKGQHHYYMARCIDVNTKDKTVTCEELGDFGETNTFTLPYNKLVIGVGCKANTFNIPGVEEYAYFLKELHDARKIRGRIIELFERASLPNRTVDEKRKLLHIVIVGGGPTGIEFGGELSDFFWRDLSRYFPDAPIHEVCITILEASNKILSAFDENLVKQAVRSIMKTGVHIRTDTLVKEVKPNAVVLSDGTEIPCGMVVWSTGNGPNTLMQALRFPKSRAAKILVDEHLRVQGEEDVYALGDCAEMEGQPLPATAQVAQAQGHYLASLLNGKTQNPFVFISVGIMAYIGRQKSIMDSKYFKGTGLLSWILWRSVYLTRLELVKNKCQVPFEWVRTFIWGRDVTTFGDQITKRYQKKYMTQKNPLENKPATEAPTQQTPSTQPAPTASTKEETPSQLTETTKEELKNN